MTELDKILQDFESKLGISQEKAQPKSLPSLMVVDDDPGFLRSLVDTLSDDYEVIACSNGQEALQRLETRICTVILDIKMPGMSGLEVIKEIKKRMPDLPVIFNTGYPGEYMEAHIEKEYQPFGYVTKDNPQILMAHLKSAVKHFHLTQSYLDLIGNLEKKVEERTRQIGQALKSLKDAKDREEYLDQQLRIQEVMRTGEDIAAGILHDNKNCMQPIENILYLVPYVVDMLDLIFGDTKCISNDLKEKLKNVGVDTRQGNLLWRSLADQKDLAIRASEEILKGYEYYRQVYNPRENGRRDLNKDLEAGVFLTIDRNDRSYIETKLDLQPVNVPHNYDSALFNRGIFINIIKNSKEAIIMRRAAEQSESTGKILIKSEQLGEKTFISFYDNGIGIQDGFEEKIFSKKFTSKSSGTGLGLFNARFLLNELGCGRIYAGKSEIQDYVTKVTVELISHGN